MGFCNNALRERPSDGFYSDGLLQRLLWRSPRGAYVLDWNAHRHRSFIVQKGIDDLAKAVPKLSENIGRVVSAGALIAQDRAAQRVKQAEARAAREARRIAASQASDETSGDGPQHT